MLMWKTQLSRARMGSVITSTLTCFVFRVLEAPTEIPLHMLNQAESVESKASLSIQAPSVRPIRALVL